MEQGSKEIKNGIGRFQVPNDPQIHQAIKGTLEMEDWFILRYNSSHHTEFLKLFACAFEIEITSLRRSLLGN